MGTPFIERPNWFTKEKYLEYKDQGLRDREIRENILFVGERVFNRFKREIGVIGIGNRGRYNNKIDYDIARELYLKGHRAADIAQRFGCKRKSLYRGNKMTGGGS